MAKLIFLAIGALLLLALVVTIIQFFVISILKKKEEKTEEKLKRRINFQFCEMAWESRCPLYMLTQNIKTKTQDVGKTS